MTEHLASITLNALVDGELSGEQFTTAKAHLDRCPACTSSALNQALLKTATAKAGQRYAVPSSLQERLQRLASQPPLPSNTSRVPTERSVRTAIRRFVASGWAIAAMLFVLTLGWIVLQQYRQRSEVASIERAALTYEISDLHIAALAATQPPDVVSSDRHTVKPWFQGKLPFSFNLPENLPGDTKLDGANLTYLHNHPVAQLLYSIGRHHVSVFVAQRSENAKSENTKLDLPQTEHSGFHIAAFDTAELEFIAVSDVDPARLSGLMQILEQSQTKP